MDIMMNARGATRRESFKKWSALPTALLEPRGQY